MKLLLIIAMIVIPSIAFTQTDTTKVEQYCQLVAQARLLSTKVNISIDWGQERRLFADNRIKDEDGRVKKFNSVIDALNYMGQQGWVLVNAFPVSTGNGAAVYHYVFKRSFLKSEVDKAESE